MAFALTGLVLHGTLFVALTGTCAFDSGRLASDWRDCLIPLALLATPGVIVVVALLRVSQLVLATGAAVAGLFALLSLTGPGLFLLIPAVLYAFGAGSDLSAEPNRQGRRSWLALGLLGLLLAGAVAYLASSQGKRVREVELRPLDCEENERSVVCSTPVP